MHVSGTSRKQLHKTDVMCNVPVGLNMGNFHVAPGGAGFWSHRHWTRKCLLLAWKSGFKPSSYRVREHGNQDFPQAFLLAWCTGVHLLTYQHLTTYLSSCPSCSCCTHRCTLEVKRPLGRNAGTGNIHIHWGRVTNAERFYYLAFCPPFGGSSALCISSLALFPHLCFVSLLAVCLCLCVPPPLPSLSPLSSSAFF